MFMALLLGLRTIIPHYHAGTGEWRSAAFSNGKKLQEDFRNPVIINEPRGKVYSTISNQSFTDAKKKLLDRHHCKIAK